MATADDDDGVAALGSGCARPDARLRRLEGVDAYLNARRRDEAARFFFDLHELLRGGSALVAEFGFDALRCNLERRAAALDELIDGIRCTDFQEIADDE